jgi:hypothetical protein
MIRTILTYLITGMLIVLLGMWLWSGGWTLIKNAVQHVPNPLDIIWGTSTSTYAITLPGAVPIPQGPDISHLTDPYSDSGNQSDSDSMLSAQEQLARYQAQYNSLRAQAQISQSVSNRSPYAGAISLSAATAADALQPEYITLDANQQVPVGGWSLLSTHTGVRATIPAQAKGPGGAVQPIVLRAGDTALVISASSPTASGLSASWHIYLSAGNNLWSNSHDTIELLDASGRIVDTISY